MHELQMDGVSARLTLAALTLATCLWCVRRPPNETFSDERPVAPAAREVFANFRKLGDLLRGVGPSAGGDEDAVKDEEATADVSTESLEIIDRLLARPAVYLEVLERSRAADAYRFEKLAAIARSTA